MSAASPGTTSRQASRIGQRREPAEARVRPLGVIVLAPGFEHDARMGQRAEQRLVQELVAEPAIEALDERVLGRFARRYVVPADAALVGPVQHGVGGQLGAVVRDDRRRLCSAGDDPVELAPDPETGDRGVGNERQAFPRAIVDHGEDPEASAIDHLIVHEIQGPALVGGRG